MASVDSFVFYDDVSFIKQGWVNRNRMLIQGGAHMFTVPLQDASSNRTIGETYVCKVNYPRWREKFLKTVALAYSKAPHFKITFELISEVLDGVPGTIADLSSRSVLAVCSRFGISPRIEFSSQRFANRHLSGQERVLDICLAQHAETYINAPGGRSLYDHHVFRERGLELRFLREELSSYPQFGYDFLPGLSIIDVMMFNSSDSISQMVNRYTLEL